MDRRRFEYGSERVKNLFDTNPPFTNSVGLTFQLGYDPSYYDARARFVYGSIRYAFK